MEDRPLEYHYATVDVERGEEFQVKAGSGTTTSGTYRLVIPEGFELFSVIRAGVNNADVVLVK